MKSKKAQEGIIVTVLLVLVAIAAVGAIGYFIMNASKSGMNTATDKTECLKITIGIDKVTNAVSNNLVLSRGSDDIAISKLNIYVNGKLNSSTTSFPNKLETASVSVSDLKVADIVRVNAILNTTNYACESGAEATVVAG